MPPHELADFFETFHVFVEPVYAPMHFYGTALLYVPTVWLHLPIWLMPAPLVADVFFASTSTAEPDFRLKVSAMPIVVSAELFESSSSLLSSVGCWESPPASSSACAPDADAQPRTPLALDHAVGWRDWLTGREVDAEVLERLERPCVVS